MKQAHILLLVIILVGSTDTRPQAQAPRGRTVTSSVDYVVPSEATIAERLESIDAVAHVRVVGPSRTRSFDMTPILQAMNPGISFPETVIPITEYDLQVIEVIKAHSTVVAGTTIKLGGRGGRVAHGQVDLVTEGLGYELTSGGTYLLFLKFNESLGMLTTTPFDVFMLDGPRVTTTRVGLETEYGKLIGNRPPPEVLEVVREAAAAQ